MAARFGEGQSRWNSGHASAFSYFTAVLVSWRAHFGSYLVRPRGYLLGPDIEVIRKRNPMFQHWVNKAELENLFVGIATALRVALVLDGIDELPESCGYRIRSHDLYGPLPDIEIEYNGDREQVLDWVSLETARLGAIVRLRCDLATQVNDCEFIIPTSLGKLTVVGIRIGGRTILAKGRNPFQAYQKLNRHITQSSLQVA
jgi:hypothetical protein